MAEIPQGYFPDVWVQWGPRHVGNHSTRLYQGKYSTREQRRAQLPVGGFRRWTASSSGLDQSTRRIVADFLTAKRGRLIPFYFWLPVPQTYFNDSVGTITTATSIVIPRRLTNPAGGVTGSVTDVRVAGTTQTYTLTNLLPRPTTYASLMFDGSSTYVDCGPSATLRSTGDKTFAAWIYLTTTSTAQAYFVCGNQTFNASGTAFAVDVTTGKLVFRTNQAGASTAASSTSAVPRNRWVHVAAVRSGTTVTFYVDGVANGSGTGVSNPVTATISFRLAAPVSPMQGMMQDIRVYSTALSASDVASVMAGTLPGHANLDGWWLLTEGFGTTTADASGRANTGTLTNAPTWVAGETLVTFSGSQTGAVTWSGLGRERIIARNDSDQIGQAFLPNAADAVAMFDLAIKELN